jgi:hypothetical protein
LIFKRLLESASTKEPPTARRRLLDDAWEKRSSILDHAVILEDVRVLLQNFALSRITGRKVPLRQPLEPNLPHVIEDRDGNLSIVQSRDVCRRALSPRASRTASISGLTSAAHTLAHLHYYNESGTIVSGRLGGRSAAVTCTAGRASSE